MVPLLKLGKKSITTAQQGRCGTTLAIYSDTVDRKQGCNVAILIDGWMESSITTPLPRYVWDILDASF